LQLTLRKIEFSYFPSPKEQFVSNVLREKNATLFWTKSCSTFKFQQKRVDTTLVDW